MTTEELKTFVIINNKSTTNQPSNMYSITIKKMNLNGEADFDSEVAMITSKGAAAAAHYESEANEDTTSCSSYASSHQGGETLTQK